MINKVLFLGLLGLIGMVNAAQEQCSSISDTTCTPTEKDAIGGFCGVNPSKKDGLHCVAIYDNKCSGGAEQDRCTTGGTMDAWSNDFSSRGFCKLDTKDALYCDTKIVAKPTHRT